MLQNHMTLPLDGTWQLIHCPVGTGSDDAHPGDELPYQVPGDVHTPLIKAGVTGWAKPNAQCYANH